MFRYLYVLMLLLAVSLTGCQEKTSNDKKGLDSEEATSQHAEQLKPLEWLTGNWSDEEGDRKILLSSHWGMHKNFIEQKFTLNVAGKEVLFGLQLIGWDPDAKRIRSWVFDSEGTFGEGFWRLQGDQWIVAMTFTFADGKKGSALHLYQYKDEKNYSFASQERDSGGELLPDIGPIQVTRQSNSEGGEK